MKSKKKMFLGLLILCLTASSISRAGVMSLRPSATADNKNTDKRPPDRKSRDERNQGQENKGQNGSQNTNNRPDPTPTPGTNVNGLGDITNANTEGKDKQNSTTAANNKVEADKGNPPLDWRDYVYYGLLTFAGLAVLGILSLGVAYFVRKIKGKINWYFMDAKDRQKRLAALHQASIVELERKLEARFGEQRTEFSNLNGRLNTIRQELDALRRASLNAPAMSPGYFNYQEPAPEVKEAPLFPVSAVDYLSKIRGNTVSVKSDSLNGILVKEPDGNGELVLVEDYSAPGGLLYIIPKVSNFKTKQDFYSYYEKYYDCHRPSAGEVWIVEPAVVNKVTGGWQLRERGELEVR